jgi:hypothetical protein
LDLCQSVAPQTCGIYGIPGPPLSNKKRNSGDPESDSKEFDIGKKIEAGEINEHARFSGYRKNWVHCRAKEKEQLISVFHSNDDEGN